MGEHQQQKIYVIKVSPLDELGTLVKNISEKLDVHKGCIILSFKGKYLGLVLMKETFKDLGINNHANITCLLKE